MLEMLWEACPLEVAGLAALTVLCAAMLAVCVAALVLSDETEVDEIAVDAD